MLLAHFRETSAVAAAGVSLLMIMADFVAAWNDAMMTIP
jgi:hypothetical protein